MTTQNKATLTLLFEQGDIPTGTNYADLIDSYVNVAETSGQTIASPLTATEFITSRVSATNGNFTGTVSAVAINVAGQVAASATRWGNGIVSAAGSTQATAAPLIYTVNEGKGVVNGESTGYALLANKAGWVQYLFNRGVSANIWPPTGGQINGLAANAAYSVGASAMVTIVHIGASAYAVG